MSDDVLICPKCNRQLPSTEPICPVDHGITGGVQGVRPDDLERTPRSKRHLLGVTISDAYVINGYLGSGGFGAVYRAEQKALGRDVALKLLMIDAVNDPMVTNRFRREARTAAALLDPNVVTLFDYGETALSDQDEDRALWIAMELVIGPTLKEVLRTGPPLGLEGAVRTGTNILRGLTAAHQLGVVHRDLKPGNVLIDQTKRRPHFARLFDFGIASLQGSGGHTTQMGQGGVLGTPKYMAPEQWRAQQTMPATDIYAFGVMMAEMLLGRAPIPKMELVKMAAAHCRGARPKVTVTNAGESVPRVLTEFIQICMAIDPRQRYGSAREALDVLESIEGRLVGPGRWATRPPSASMPLLKPDLSDRPSTAPPSMEVPRLSPEPPIEALAAAPPPSAAADVELIDALSNDEYIDDDLIDTSAPPPSALAPLGAGPPPPTADDTLLVPEVTPGETLESSVLLGPPNAPEIPPPFGSLAGSPTPPPGGFPGTSSEDGSRRPSRPLAPARQRNAALLQGRPSGSMNAIGRSTGGALRGRATGSLNAIARSTGGSLNAAADSVELPPMARVSTLPPPPPQPSLPPSEDETGQGSSDSGAAGDPSGHHPSGAADISSAPARFGRPVGRGRVDDTMERPERRPSIPPAGVPTDPGVELPDVVSSRMTPRGQLGEGGPFDDEPPAGRRGAVWPWTAAAALLLFSLLAVRFMTEGRRGTPIPPGRTGDVAEAPKLPPVVAGADPVDTAGDRPVAGQPTGAEDPSPATAADAGPPDTGPAVLEFEAVAAGPDAGPPDAGQRVAPAAQVTADEPKRPQPGAAKPDDRSAPVAAAERPNQPAVKPRPVKPRPVKPRPVKPRPVKPRPVKPRPVKPRPVKPAPAKPPAAVDGGAAMATYRRAVDAMNRGALNSARRLFTQALAQGLSGPRANEARQHIKRLAAQGELEDDF